MHDYFRYILKHEEFLFLLKFWRPSGPSNAVIRADSVPSLKFLIQFHVIVMATNCLFIIMPSLQLNSPKNFYNLAVEINLCLSAFGCLWPPVA